MNLKIYLRENPDFCNHLANTHPDVLRAFDKLMKIFKNE